MRCAAHILNLVVKDGLKDLHPSIVKVRAAVRFVGLPLQCFKSLRFVLKKKRSSAKILFVWILKLNGIPLT